jgi:aspartate/methionine/tyrosine aminotransferase
VSIVIPPRVTAISPPQIDVINARAAEWRARGADVISLGQALPGFAPPSSVFAAAQAALLRPDTHIYSADAGVIELRQALCRRLAEDFTVTADPETEVIITAGANQAFMLALMTVLEPGDEVLLPAPYFMNHEMAVRAIGAVPIEVPLDKAAGFSLRWIDLEARLTPRTRAVVICSPSNPTGAVFGATALQEIARELLARNIVILSDETYMHFVYGDCQHFSLASVPNWRESVILLGSFSKSFGMTGWRVGYLIASSRTIHEALKIQDAMLICAPVIAQEAVLAAVEQAWHYPQQYLEAFNTRRCYLRDRLDTIPTLHWQPTQGGFFAFVEVAGCADAQQLSLAILDRVHVVTIPGNLFGVNGQGFLRLSYGSVDLSRLEMACDRLLRYFSEWYQVNPK